MFTSTHIRRVSEILLFALVAGTILWKGGKALDAVWALSLAASLLAFTFLYLRQHTSDLHPKGHDTRTQITLGLFVVLTILSFSFSQTRNYGLDEVLQTVALFLVFLSVAEFSDEFTSRFMRVVSVTLLIACIIGGATYILQPVSRFVGTFFDYRFHTDYWPNAWAEFVLLAWPMLITTLFLRPLPSTDLRDDILRSSVLGIALVCFFLSYSRGALLSFFMQLILLAFLFLVRRRKHIQWERIGVIILVLSIISIILFAGLNHIRSQLYPVESVLEKATLSSAEGSSSVSERAQFFSQALLLTRESPLIGHGPYSFRFLQPHLQTNILATSDHPHNVFLKLAMERGIPAALLFVLFLVFVYIQAFFKIFHSPLGSSDETFAIVLTVSTAGVLLHNLIDYNLQFVGISLPLWISFSLLSLHTKFVLTKRSYRELILLTLVVLLFVTSAYELKNLGFSSSARKAERRGDDSRALELYQYTKPSLFPRDALLAEGAMLLNAGNFRDAENATTEYLSLNPGDARPWRLLGDIYIAWGKDDEAIRAYEKAFQYGKANDAGILRGLVTVLKNDPLKLLDRRHDLDSLLNDFGLAILQNTHFIALSSSVEESIATAELLARSFPQDSSLYKDLSLTMREHADEERSRYTSRPRGFLW